MALLYLLQLCILHIFLIRPGLGVEINIVPSKFILGRPAAPTNMICRAAGAKDTFQKIYSMSLVRKRPGMPNEWIAIAELDSPVAVISPTLPNDMADLEPTVTNGLDLKTPLDSQFTVSFKTENFTCSDATTYACYMSYQNPQLVGQSENVSTHLAVHALPSQLQMSVRINNSITVDTFGNSETQPRIVNIGDIITLTCNGVIGSDNQTQISWNETSALQSDLIFNRYNGDSGLINQPPTGPTDCHYSRPSSISYTVQPADANRRSVKFAFRCYIETTFMNQNDNPESYEYPMTPTCYFQTGGATCCPGSGSGSGSGSGKITNYKTLLIAMSVVSAVALVVCLIIIVRQRILLQRRNGGDNAASTSQRQTRPGVHFENKSSYMISSDLRSDDSHIYTACDEENEPPRALTTGNAPPRVVATENTSPRTLATENTSPRALTTENTSPRAFTTGNTSPRADAYENVCEADHVPSRVGANDNSQMFQNYERLQKNGECHMYEKLRAHTLSSKLVD